MDDNQHAWIQVPAASNGEEWLSLPKKKLGTEDI
jgi:hypothetical protein